MSNIPEFTISEFSRSIKRVVEDNFGYVRLKGEISGFKKASSGHLYFNLKDDSALINAVCFRSIAGLINFDVADGLDVIASGQITTYEGRSNYQIIVEKLEIAGVGAILAAIEKRKLRLLEGGYFDEKNKKPLPFLPKNIGIITSPTGAVIEDIINRISARFPTHLLVYPAAVQGKNAVDEVILGIKYFNNTKDKPDVIIIARGGGSFEDLLPFNDEELVKEVFKSKIPIISAIGHETDTTLIDYVADVRAPTPSAAAEIVVPVLKDLQNFNENLGKRLSNYLANLFVLKQNSLISLSNNLLHPKVRLSNLEQNLSHLFLILESNFGYALKNKEQAVKSLANQVLRPSSKYENWQNQLLFLEKNLHNNSQNFLKDYKNKVGQLSKLLVSYDYKNVLARGYAVARCSKKIVSSKNEVYNNQILDIEVMDGSFNAVVIGKKSLPKKKESNNSTPLLF
jgi:exodeoxyribonuclease VII large subunit